MDMDMDKENPDRPTEVRAAPVCFSLGQVVMTRGAMQSLTAAEVHAALIRHAAGDWGDVNRHDRQENELALVEDLRLFSVYHTAAGQKFWIITEADRSATTILLPEEY